MASDIEITATDPTTNKKILAGYNRLAFAIVKQATRDLESRDPLTVLAALYWWLSDGPEWLELLGFDPKGGLHRLFVR